MPRSDLTVRVQSLDDQWQVLGVDRARGIVPEGVTYSHDTWGSSSASFTLKRDPGVPWPDLSAFTPVDIHVGGVPCWSGRVAQTPTSDSPDSRQIGVQCAGWQYHLDDDAYEGKYVHTRLSEWQDIRSHIDTDLTGFSSAVAIAGGDGVIVMSVPTGVTLASGAQGGVYLDMGPTNTAKRVVVTYQSGSTATLNLNLVGGDAIGTASESFTLDASPLATSSTTVAQTFTTARRYVRLEYESAAGTTGGENVYLKITAIQVFAATAYESGNASILKSSQVVTDALTKAVPLLSTDTSRISAGTFSIPDYSPDGYRTPREHIAAVNAYENYQAYVDVDQKFVYASRVTSPVVEVGAWSGVAFEDASTNSAQDIYNRVVVEGTGPDGNTLRAERSAGQQSSVMLQAVASPVADNPSFATDAASWTNVTRDTGTFDSTPAAGLITAPGTPVTETFTGTFTKGVTYVLRFAIRQSTTSDFHITFGVTGDSASVIATPAAGAFVTYTLSWTPTANRSGVTFRNTLTNIFGGASYWIDSLALFKATPTIVDRRGFTRTMILPASTAMTSTGGNKLGDTYLVNHRTTPLKGSLRVTSPTGVRRVQGGAGVHPSQLGLFTNQVVRLAHRIDFDNGNVGKDGTIVAVSYTHDGESASVELDNTSANFEALLSRLAINVGQVT